MYHTCTAARRCSLQHGLQLLQHPLCRICTTHITDMISALHTGFTNVEFLTLHWRLSATRSMP